VDRGIADGDGPSGNGDGDGLVGDGDGDGVTVRAVRSLAPLAVVAGAGEVGVGGPDRVAVGAIAQPVRMSTKLAAETTSAFI